MPFSLQPQTPTPSKAKRKPRAPDANAPEPIDPNRGAFDLDYFRGERGVDGAPTVVSFSGGRTSAMMLRLLLDAHGGRLPFDCLVTFANTGKEREETLVFVEECSQRWGVRIVWLEYRHHEQGAPRTSRFEEVTFRTASRKGEPFDAIIRQRGMVPRPMIRFCTEILKVRVMRDYALTRFAGGRWNRILGLRADEGIRAGGAEDSGHEFGDVKLPLFYAGVREPDVRAFWRKQPFDLGLESYEGNCDLCMLKSQSKRVRIMADRPDLAEWWLERDKIGEGFRPGDKSYADLMARTHLPVLPGILHGEESLHCECTD